MSLSQHPKRIVTRPDFDGIVCAVLIRCAESADLPILWAEPSEIQKGRVDLEEGDVLANLPYDKRCLLWFDHHDSNRPAHGFEGLFRLAPSAAGLVYEYYRDRLDVDFDELVHWADRIDSADLSQDQVRYPQNYPYVLLSMTVTNRNATDGHYWNRLVALLMNRTIDEVMAEAGVRKRCQQTVAENKAYADTLKAYTTLEAGVAITDLRELTPAPAGNRFLVYCLFPEAHVQAKIRYDYRDRRMAIISLGHSIFNPICKVNVGKLLSRFGGGGHPGAGACRLPVSDLAVALKQIVWALQDNQPN